jgi:drug/metabolite transporter (DMT)-like permease
MSWFFISLSGTALFAVSNFIDKILISRYFKGGGVGALAIYSALIGIFILPFPLIFDIDFLSPGYMAIGIMIASGLAYLLGIIPYLYALTQDDTSAVVPIFQTIPIFSYLFGFFFLHEQITDAQVVGMLLIILGSIAISLDLSGVKVRFKMKGTLLMLLSSFLIALSGFLFKFVGTDSGFILTSFWTYMGYTFLGIALFVFSRNYRSQFIHTLRANSVQIVGINIFNEVVAIGGKMLQNLATLLAPLALTVAVNGFQPIFVLVYGILFTLFFPHIVSETISKRHLFFKSISIAIIIFGALLIN